jgi:hypothetical protein
MNRTTYNALDICNLLTNIKSTKMLVYNILLKFLNHRRNIKKFAGMLQKDNVELDRIKESVANNRRNSKGRF